MEPHPTRIRRRRRDRLLRYEHPGPPSVAPDARADSRRELAVELRPREPPFAIPGVLRARGLGPQLLSVPRGLRAGPLVDLGERELGPRWRELQVDGEERTLLAVEVDGVEQVELDRAIEDRDALAPARDEDLPAPKDAVHMPWRRRRATRRLRHPGADERVLGWRSDLRFDARSVDVSLRGLGVARAKPRLLCLGVERLAGRFFAVRALAERGCEAERKARRRRLRPRSSLRRGDGDRG